MSEFGENLKRMREEKGMTQQAFADQLYVTRQAVSRWENGSRSPDLLTAKNIAVLLDVSMDDLLSINDLKQYPEKAPVLETPVSKMVQTVIMAFCFLVSFVELVWIALGGLISYFKFGIQTPEVLSKSYILLNGLLNLISLVIILFICGFGLYKCIRNEMIPKTVGFLGIAFFLACACDRLIFELFYRTGIINVVIVCIYIVIAALIFSFFNLQKIKSPAPVCLSLGAYGFLFLAMKVYSLIKLGFNNAEDFYAFFLDDSLGTINVILFLALLIYSSIEVNRKRRLASRL